MRKIGMYKKTYHETGKKPREYRKVPIKRRPGEDILSWLNRKAAYGDPLNMELFDRP